MISFTFFFFRIPLASVRRKYSEEARAFVKRKAGAFDHVPRGKAITVRTKATLEVEVHGHAWGTRKGIGCTWGRSKGLTDPKT